MSVLREDVKYIADLARINIDENQIDGFVEDLNIILKYVDELQELDTDHVEALVNPYEYENEFREDSIGESLKPSEVLKNSNNIFEDYIVVPKVLEGGE